MYRTTIFIDPQTARLREYLRDTLDNLITSLFGDDAERDGAVEDVASVEICLYELSLGRELPELPFTFTSLLRKSKYIMAESLAEYQDTKTYRDAARILYFFLYVVSPNEVRLDLANQILQLSDRKPGHTAIAKGQYTTDMRAMLDEKNPEHRRLLDMLSFFRKEEQAAVERCLNYLLMHERRVFWSEAVARMDDATAAAALRRVMGDECKDERSSEIESLLSTIDADSWDTLLLMGALRRRVLGPAKHCLHGMVARKPYLEVVVREAVDFAVQTLRSQKPRTEEAVEAIKYAFRKIRRFLMHQIPLKAPQFIKETPWNEQCRAVVRAAGLTTAHADVLMAALEAPRQHDRKEFARIFADQLLVPALSTLIIRTLPVDDARMFLEQTVLGGGVPLRHEVLRETIKTNPVPDWPLSLQFGLLMRLALPPRNPQMSRPKALPSPMHTRAGRATNPPSPVRSGSSNHARPAATPGLKSAPNARRPAAMNRTPPAQRPLPPMPPHVRWLQRRGRACEMCLTM